MEEDDESWKVFDVLLLFLLSSSLFEKQVRRAAAKTISGVIITNPELVGSFWSSVAPTLIKRFSEREDSVRLDVFSTFNDLVRQTGNVSKVFCR